MRIRVNNYKNHDITVEIGMTEKACQNIRNMFDYCDTIEHDGKRYELYVDSVDGFYGIEIH